MGGVKAKHQAARVANLFQDTRYIVRAKAAFACGKLRNADCIPQLADLLEDSAPAVREEAVHALSASGEDGADYIGKVAERLGDTAPNVRAASIAALANMGEQGHCYASAVAQRLAAVE